MAILHSFAVTGPMADAVMWAPSWPATWRELAIVRVGYRYDSPYEVHQHRRIGGMVGLSAAQLDACVIRAGQAALSAEEQAIVRLTDALVANHRWSAAELAEAQGLLSTNGLADFVLTVGFYQAVSNFLNVFGVEVEAHDIYARTPEEQAAQGG